MKNRPLEFLPQDKRDQLNKEYQETVDRMSGSKSDKHVTYQEALVDCLPKSQRKYAGGKSYDFLCLQLKMFLEGTYTREKIESLRNAKENFESYCETMESKI